MKTTMLLNIFIQIFSRRKKNCMKNSAHSDNSGKIKETVKGEEKQK